MDDQLLFLDTETTDLDDGRLVELAYAIHRPGAPLPEDIVSFRVRPPVPISFDAMATHHITESSVINQLPFNKEHPSYRTVSDIVKDSVLVAHNAPFDIEVLNREGIEVDRFIDTKRCAMHLFPDAPRFNLQYLRYYLGCYVVGIPHSAEGDVTVLIALFDKIRARIDQEYETQTMRDVIEKAIELSTQPVILKLVPPRLKKWKGRSFQEVNMIDRSYIEWAWKQDWSDLDIGEDLRYTLDHWIKVRTV